MAVKKAKKPAATKKQVATKKAAAGKSSANKLPALVKGRMPAARKALAKTTTAAKAGLQTAKTRIAKAMPNMPGMPSPMLALGAAALATGAIAATVVSRSRAKKKTAGSKSAGGKSSAGMLAAPKGGARKKAAKSAAKTKS